MKTIDKLINNHIDTVEALMREGIKEGKGFEAIHLKLQELCTKVEQEALKLGISETQLEQLLIAAYEKAINN